MDKKISFGLSRLNAPFFAFLTAILINPNKDSLVALVKKVAETVPSDAWKMGTTLRDRSVTLFHALLVYQLERPEISGFYELIKIAAQKASSDTWVTVLADDNLKENITIEVLRITSLSNSRCQLLINAKDEQEKKCLYLLQLDPNNESHLLCIR